MRHLTIPIISISGHGVILRYILTVLAFLSFTAESALTEKGAVEKVISTFSKSIETKDKESFLNLFLTKNTPWFSSMSAHDYQLKTQKGSTVRANNHDITKFIDWVVSEQRSTEVKFSNCKISHDSAVASVYCNYAFYLSAQKTNFGNEIFTLVKSGESWKIISVVFSTTAAPSS